MPHFYFYINWVWKKEKRKKRDLPWKWKQLCRYSSSTAAFSFRKKQPLLLLIHIKPASNDTVVAAIIAGVHTATLFSFFLLSLNAYYKKIHFFFFLLLNFIIYITNRTKLWMKNYYDDAEQRKYKIEMLKLRKIHMKKLI